jgi:hypothetical protein
LDVVAVTPAFGFVAGAATHFANVAREGAIADSRIATSTGRFVPSPAPHPNRQEYRVILLSGHWWQQSGMPLRWALLCVS